MRTASAAVGEARRPGGDPGLRALYAFVLVTVRDDFRALARLLPRVRGEYPPELHAAITRFVLENGGLSPEERRRLETPHAADA